jgi:hypothetical protein
MIHAFDRARQRTRLRISVLALIAFFASAGCDNSNPLATNEPTEVPAVPVAADSAAPADSALAADSAEGADSAEEVDGSLDPAFLTAIYSYGMRFGTFGCSSSGLGAYNLCNRSAGSSSAATMSALRAVRAKVILNQGGYSKFKDSRGRYSPTKYYNWVQSLRPYASSWRQYVTNGTLVGIQVIDDRGSTNWGGVAISNAQIDQMAKWWKQILPGVTTFVSGGYAWNLLGYSWSYLDGSINQYNARYMGDVKTWRDRSVAAAARARTSLILSMNVLNGGKIYRGCYHGASSSYCSMTPTELRSYGATIAAASGICGVGTWKYSSTYHARSGVTSALKYVAWLASKRSQPSCKRR